jgi:serine protease Do
MPAAWALAAVLAAAAQAPADVSFAEVVRKTNPKIVKVYGAGGFRGVTAYCSGVLISPDGYILTVYSPTLDAHELRVHLYDGTRHQCELVAAEPQLDIALIRIKDRERFKDLPLDYFDLSKPPPEVRVGDWVLAFSNLFEIATRDEPVSVQRGVVSAITPFAGRRGIHEAAYKGRAIIVDAITNNPGAHGGALTNRKGELIGIIGKELKNAQSETWVNYAMSIADLTDFALRAMRGDYKPLERPEARPIADNRNFHGIVLVPDVLDRTPPYVEEVVANSPAARAGIKADDLIVFVRFPRPESPGESEERVITSCRTFRETLAGLAPGTPIKVIVRRGTQLLSLDLTLEPAPER